MDSSSTGAFFIRAPLTIDDDDDDDDDNSFISESHGNGVVVTDSGYGSSSTISSNGNEGYVSAEEFESAAERPGRDEEIVEGSGFVDKYRVSRPLVVADPDDEFSQKSVGSDEYDHQTIADLALTVTPIAQLSMDDDGFEFDELSSGDEEGLMSEGEDANGVLPVVRVPSMWRVDSAPRIKVMESEGEEDGPVSELLSPDRSVNSSGSSKFVGFGSAELSTTADTTAVNSSADASVSTKLVEDEDNGVTPEAHNESLNREADVTELAEKSVEQGPALRNSCEEKIESKHQDGHGMQEHNAVTNQIEELKVVVVGVDAEEQSDGQNNTCVSFDDWGASSLGRDSDNDNLESKTEPETDSGVQLYDPLAVISSVSADDAMKVKKTHAVDSTLSEPNLYMQNGDLHETFEDDGLRDSESSASKSLISEAEAEAYDGEERQEARKKGLLLDDDFVELILGSSVTTKDMMQGMEERFASSSLAESEDSQVHPQAFDGGIIMESDHEPHTESGGDGVELFDSATLLSLLRSATSAASEGSAFVSNHVDGSNVHTHQHHTHSGSLFPSLSSASPPDVDGDVSRNNLSEEERRKTEKIQLLRVKFLRLVQRLGHCFDDSVVAQVLYRLALALGRHSSRDSSQAFNIEPAKGMAAQFEVEDKEPLDFSLSILVLGKTGVGKSATINSIFSEEKATINAFEPATSSVKVITGIIHGVQIRILDTPGLRSPATEGIVNRKTLASIKKLIKRFPPDVVLYVDRLDAYTRDHNDLPLLRSLTSSLGSSIWGNAILCLTHAASDPPDGPSGLPLSYDVFVAQQSHAIQQSISQAVGNLRLLNPNMMYPVSLVENHPSCQKNRIGEIVLPNGQSWRSYLLLLCFSLKILSEATSVSKHYDHSAPTPKKFFGFSRSAPLSHFLSSMLQTRTHPKISTDLGAEDVDSDVGLGDLLEPDQEDEYDQLPPFKPLKKFQIAKLSKDQRRAYFEEYDYRIKLLQMKEWKEEVKKFREMKEQGNRNNYYDEMESGTEDESPAAIPVMLPDFVLQPSFDGDNPVYRYRLLEPTSQLFVRPVLDSQGWDHDCGYDGVSVESNFAIASQFPGEFAFQITKDKKQFNIHLDSSISAKHGESGSTMAGLDIQTVGRQLAYILRGDTKFRNFKINKTSGGVSVTALGELLATGLKIEDEIAVGKHLVLLGNAGAVRSHGDTAYGANLELRIKDEDFPIGNDNTSLGLSMMNIRGEANIIANLQSQFSVGRGFNMAIRVGLNNKHSGQITVKLSSSEQLQMALVGVVPIALSIIRSLCLGSTGQTSTY